MRAGELVCTWAHFAATLPETHPLRICSTAPLLITTPAFDLMLSVPTDHQTRVLIAQCRQACPTPIQVLSAAALLLPGRHLFSISAALNKGLCRVVEGPPRCAWAPRWILLPKKRTPTASACPGMSGRSHALRCTVMLRSRGPAHGQSSHPANACTCLLPCQQVLPMHAAQQANSVWHVQAAKCVIPFSTLYTPHKQIEELLVSCPCQAAWAQSLTGAEPDSRLVSESLVAAGMLPGACDRRPPLSNGQLGIPRAGPWLAQNCILPYSAADHTLSHFKL